MGAGKSGYSMFNIRKTCAWIIYLINFEFFSLKFLMNTWFIILSKYIKKNNIQTLITQIRKVWIEIMLTIITCT